MKTSVKIENNEVVILGATYKDAIYWKGYYSREYPELKNAREFSAYDPRGMEGYRAKKVFISPDAHKSRYYRESVLTLDRGLYKTLGSDRQIVYLGELSQ